MAPLMHYTLKEKDITVFKKIFRDCLDAKNEKVFIAGDYGTSNFIAPTLVRGYSIAAEELGLDFELYIQSAKTRGQHTDPLLVQKLRLLPKESIVIMMVSSRIGNLGPIGLSFRKFCTKNMHKFLSASSLGYLPDSNVPAFLKSLDVDYRAMQKECYRVKKILDNGTHVAVTTKAGTDINFSIKEREAKTNTGVYTKPGTGGNLPAGETYIAPVEETAEGNIVIDGSVKLSNKTRMPKTPIRLEVSKGVITKMNRTPEAMMLEDVFLWAQQKSISSLSGIKTIGELGIGMNPQARIIGSTIIDEKALNTCHFAIGSNAWFGGKTYSVIHLDQVVRNPMIKVDGKIIKRWD